MNVIGTRPDAWWKDRHAAMVRLVHLLEQWAAATGEDVTVVFEQPPSPPISSTVIEVAHAPRPRRDSADDEIVRRVAADSEPGGIRVVTSDLLARRSGPRGRRDGRGRRLLPSATGSPLMAPVTRYARSGEASIAYQVIGDGGLDLLFLTGWISQVEQLWEAPANRRFLERLAAFGRLILFDSRGTGLSDRVLASTPSSRRRRTRSRCSTPPAANAPRLLTYALGGLVGALLAADRPERIGALIMYASIARTSWAPDYDWAMTSEEREELSERNIATWGEANSEAMSAVGAVDGRGPGAGRVVRAPAAPGREPGRGADHLQGDGRPRRARPLPRIRVPTLVMHRPKELVWDVRHSRYLAEHIPGARYVELEGTDSFPVRRRQRRDRRRGRGVPHRRAQRRGARAGAADGDVHRHRRRHARAAELGDGRWRDLLARHDEDVREELARFGGREVKTVGDGFLATFDGPPSRALRCALAITARRASSGSRSASACTPASAS